MLWAELCPPSPLSTHWIHMSKPNSPLHQEMTLFRDRVFKKSHEVKMRLWGWSLIQSYCCSYKKKKKFGHRERYSVTRAQRNDCEDTARNLSPARQRDWPQEKPNLPAPRRWISSPQNCEEFLLFKPPHLWYFVMAILANKYRRDEK